MRTRGMLARAAVVAVGAGAMLGAAAPMAFAQGHGGHGGGGNPPSFTITCTVAVYDGSYTIELPSPKGGKMGKAMSACEEAGGTATVVSSRGGEE